MSKRIQIRLAAILLLVFLFAMAVAGQVQTRNCRGPVYEAKDVPDRAKINSLPDFHTLREALGPGAEAHVVVEAVLCRDGSVTDFKVIKSEPPEAAQWVVAELSLMPFKPAEFNWHTVSQKQKFDLSFNPHGVSGIDIVNTPGTNASPRLVEEIYVIGNRRLTKEDIFPWIKTKVGERFDADQVKQDLQALLKTGWFNAASTRVNVEDGVRGGVRVMFEVLELPLIKNISFEGSAGAGLSSQLDILNEFGRQHIDVAIGSPIDPVNLKKATKAIEDHFRRQGWINVKAEAVVENLSPTEVKITFKITGTNF